MQCCFQLTNVLNRRFPGLTCPKFALWDSNLDSWLAKEQKSRLRFGGRRLLSQFLLHVTDGWMRVWRHKNTAYPPRNIQPTVPYGRVSVMVWGCISHDCKLDLVTIQGNLTGDQYIRDVLQLGGRRLLLLNDEAWHCHPYTQAL
jgi:hypothetical protein